MKKQKKAYLLIDQFDYGEDVLEMSPEEAGEIFQAVIRYSLTGKKSSFNDRYLNRIFKGLIQDIDLHIDNYAEKSIKASLSRRIGIAKDNGEDTSGLKAELEFLNNEGLEAYQKRYKSVSRCDGGQRTSTNVNGREQEEEEEEVEVDDEVEVEEEAEEDVDEEVDDDEENTDLRSLSGKPDGVSLESSGTKKKKKPSFIADADQIIDYLNKKTGKSFRKVSSNRNLIIPRLKEGYKVTDFHTVIDKKWNEWHNTEMSQYLRPETLFSPAHFESYLNQSEESNHQSVKLPEYWGKPESEEDQRPASPETIATLKEMQAKMAV